MDLDDIDPEIASAMGFASFGAQPSKRRKYNHDDAFVDGQDDNRGPAKVAGSGANNIALGVRPRAAAPALESTGADHGAGDVDAVDEEKNNNKQSAKGKAKGKGKKGGPLGLADYVAWGNTVPAQPSVLAVVEKEVEVVAPVQEADAAANVEAVVLNGGDGAGSWPQGMPSQEELYALRRGVRNKRGDVAYFMPSFIEDPWKGIVR